MISGMTTAKIAVSVPRDVLQRAQRAVRRGRAASMSAYVSAALAQKATLDELDDLLVEMLEQSGGPLRPAEIRAADAALAGGARAGRRRRKKA
jgi:Arc/MetJ-type ribon-helix-helix transcriptional regulator